MFFHELWNKSIRLRISVDIERGQNLACILGSSTHAKTDLVFLTQKAPMCGRYLLKEVMIGLFC